jgi:hypothetical protein
MIDRKKREYFVNISTRTMESEEVPKKEGKVL